MSEEALLRFSAATRTDLATLLMAASRTVNAEALVAIDPNGSTGVRAAHIPLIASLDAGGTRLVTLASRMGISRQAVAMLARDLANAGITQMVEDPSDGRAQLVRLTEAGADLCNRATDYLEDRESEWRAQFGEGALRTVRSVLESLATATNRQ